MAENNPLQKKTPTDDISDSESSDEELDHAYTYLKKRDFTTLLKDQPKPVKQHYHTLQLSVTLQLKGDLIENQR